MVLVLWNKWFMLLHTVARENMDVEWQLGSFQRRTLWAYYCLLITLQLSDVIRPNVSCLQNDVDFYKVLLMR